MRRVLDVSVGSVIVIIASVVLVALAGSHYSVMNRGWYRELNLPWWKPPDLAFPIAWTIIYLLCMVSLVLIWNTRPHTSITYFAVLAFFANAVFNVAWSALFFGSKLIPVAVYDAGLLFLSVVLMAMLAWQISRPASYLLFPYAAWVLFATLLTWDISRLNP